MEILANLPVHTWVSVEVGLAAGIIHHFLIQYPRQSEIFTTIFTYLGGILSFFFVPLVRTHVLSTIAQVLIFSFVYVSTLSN